MSTTPGQIFALSQLEEICQADPYAFEILKKDLPKDDRESLWVQIGIHCGNLPKVAGGLPFRERERFWLLVPTDFPFSKPNVLTPHTRFAGWPHVQWKKHLCLYQAPEVEWDSADGMFGLIERLWIWLCHGAANKLNPPDLPIHPPVTYISKSPYILVSRINTPKFETLSWAGWIELQHVTDIRYDILGWHSIYDKIPSLEISAPAILLSKELPWEMPKKLDELLIELETQGVSRSQIISLIRVSVLQNKKDQPLLFIIGTPQRGIYESNSVRYHLMAWEIDALLIDTARMSLEKYSDYEPLREIGIKAENLFIDITKTVDVSWIRLLEDRPEVTIRRDINSPMQLFVGASACLWGCGAIGSHIAYLLVKAGIKRIVLVDKGIVTPGLLVRQMYEDRDIGQLKANALANRLKKLRPDLLVEAHAINISDMLEPGKDWAFDTDLIFDCTASHTLQAKLELAYKHTSVKNINIVSMIVGPRAERGIVVISPFNYSGSVKDVFRKTKIAACKDQSLKQACDDFYPTSEILEFFQPEPGCSDPTFVGSVTDICSLSSIMLNLAALELSKASEHANAFLVSQPHIAFLTTMEPSVTHFQWSKDIVGGATYETRISTNAWNEISGWIRQSRRVKGKTVETGGVLFGKRDDTLRIIWIDSASGPPPDSKASRTEFICGIKGVEELHESWKQLSRGSVEFVGMWHTHPEDMPFPSSRDICGMAQILTIGDPPPKKSLLLIIGHISSNPVLGVTVFERINSINDSRMIQAEIETATLSGLKI
jgi:integrative and conjugative element protein (TIGR02256 family)